MSREQIAVTLTGDASNLQRAFSVGRLAATTFGSSMEQSLKRAQTANKEYTDSLNGLGSSLKGVERLAKGYIAGFSLMKTIDTADQWGQYASRVQMATRSTDEFAHVQERMVQSAKTTYRNINETREAFINLSPVIRDMGFTLDQSIDAVDAFSGLLVVNGANAERGSAAMNALSKSLQRGKVDTQAWMTIYTTADTIVDSLSLSMGKSTDEIRRLGVAGELTGRQLVEALGDDFERIMEQVKGMPTTVRDALGNLNTAFTEFIGWQNEAYGATALMASGIDLLSDNFDLLAYAAGAAAAVYVSRFIGAQWKAVAATTATNHAIVANRVALATLAANISGASRTAVVGYGAMAAAAGTAKVAMSLVGGPAGVVTLALAAGALAWSNWGDAAESTIKIIDASKKSLAELEKEFENLTRTQQSGMILSIEKELAETETKTKESIDSIRKEMVSLFYEGYQAGGNQGLELFAEQFNSIIRSTDSATEKSEALRKSLQGLKGSVPNNVYQTFKELIQALSESSEETDDLESKLNRINELLSNTRTVDQFSSSIHGMAEADFTKLISGLTESLAVIGMSAQQAEEYKAELAGATEEQAKLAGVLAGMEDAAKKLQKATADKDVAAQKGAKDLLNALVAQEVQLRMNMARAAEYAALLALGIDVTIASQGADSAAELAGLRIQDEIEKRIATITSNIATNTELSKKGKGATQQDEGKRFIDQMKERIALLGKETELEKTLAQIAVGSLKFKSESQKQSALDLAKTLDQKTKEIELEKVLNELREEQGTSQRQLMRELEAFGKGDWERDLATSLNEVEDRYRKLIRDRVNSAHGLSNAELARIKQSLAEELAAVSDHYDKLKLIQSDWKLGATQALANYANESANIFNSIGSAFGNAFRGMGDSLTQFVMRGKLDFKSLADSIIQDMVRIAIQQSITGPLANILGGAIGSIGVPSAASIGITGVRPGLSLADGGYTGDGGKYEPAGIVHRGEYVLTKETTSRIGVPVLDRLNRGYASGGLVGRMPGVPTLAGAVAPSGGLNITINISDSGVNTQAPAGLEALAKDIGVLVDAKIREHERRSQRQGGISWQARQGAFA